ncbi:M18 family aminopeptidase [Corynebacterium sp. 153RC1]|uniref:M18 family aminopeptidase n=1 Tax=unclassified Corynebacterium TaxID=2624378 RepID=UPI00211BC77B|nr:MULTISPECIES: M18 family aminopeptidase [unclassified Corynebacterium]MCQ9352438.1 M18 family aminopeptidase [Corynebacterium sp. 209RC1]MCQ9354390.1 M18 family aminopeptidase [Corynebacterium sp. 1222RC1]MCQ9356721.1 M18 family aminopeptidase [Corynebacterium sp. 122RC1]MCQ9358785.1 M18 family aminopeptidase [Corynebacterium sp. 142RC1]MCQ9361183.1 M18 family aminopeptidase [Corynebacterium sp. 153RC1]
MVDTARTFADGFTEYVSGSPSSFHAAALGAQLLQEAGFEVLQRADAFPTKDALEHAGPRRFALVVDGALIAWVIPKGANVEESAFRIIGAHTDSPGFKLKHQSATESHGWLQANVEVYGGPIVHSWFDRDLTLAGQVTLRDGTTRLVHTPPMLTIASLAIHLSPQPRTSVEIDRQAHTQPVVGLLGGDAGNTGVLAQVAEVLGVTEADIVAHDLITSPAEPSRVLTSGLLASPRLDNLSSVFPALRALADAADDLETGKDIAVVACFDHEEVGSGSVTGAEGPLLEETLGRVVHALGGDVEQKARMFARSTMLSADAAHSVHPNYASRYDLTNAPVMGAGPVLKLSANQRYASSTRATAAWVQAVERAGVASQSFANNNAVPGGTTIGPLSATRLGIDTVDVGIPLLAMHSVRELAHIEDLHAFYRALAAFLAAA